MNMRNDVVTKAIIEKCISSFDGIRSGLKIAVKEGTMFRPLAESGLEMIDCYRTDAENFTKDGDLVTAFAAINYSHAWIDCFGRLGLFDVDSGKELFLSIPDGDEGCKITEEKMAKYLDITTRARKKLKVAPPVRSFDRRLAFQILEASESYFKDAVDYRRDDDFVRAFAAVNYSHAWLDAGARMGLFDVEEDDVLFTLYE
jgi:hypothetical protein